jgi:hypothetical protein
MAAGMNEGFDRRLSGRNVELADWTARLARAGSAISLACDFNCLLILSTPFPVALTDTKSMFQLSAPLPPVKVVILIPFQNLSRYFSSHLKTSL